MSGLADTVNYLKIENRNLTELFENDDRSEK